jgi:hypothetical protein
MQDPIPTNFSTEWQREIFLDPMGQEFGNNHGILDAIDPEATRDFIQNFLGLDKEKAIDTTEGIWNQPYSIKQFH